MHERWLILHRVVLIPVTVVVVERRGSDLLVMEAMLLRLIDDPMEAVDQVLVVLVAVKDVEHRKDIFVFFLNKSI